MTARDPAPTFPTDSLYVAPDPATGRPEGYIEAEETADGWNITMSPALAEWVREHAALDELDRADLTHLATVLQPRTTRPPGRTVRPRRQALPADAQVNVPALLLYQLARAAISTGRRDFRRSAEDLWPTVTLTSRDHAFDAFAQVRPDPKQVDPFVISAAELDALQQAMARHVRALDDLSADVLDAVCALWLQTARHPDEMTDVHVDDLLRMRGLKRKQGGTGTHGGFHEKQRREIAAKMAALAATRITVSHMPVTEAVAGTTGPRRRRTTWAGESPALVVSFEVGQVGLGGAVRPETCIAWRARPGDVFSRFLFGAGRETALLATKALAYDPYRQYWEKRLTRYLSWLWRIRGSTASYLDPIMVETVLYAIREEINPHHPSHTKERLEQAFDTLTADEVIAGWQYAPGADEAIVGQRGWAAGWRRWKVVIEPPQHLQAHYATIATPRRGRAPALPAPAEAAPLSLGERIIQARTAQGLTQLRAAELIGISNGMLSLIEHDKARPSAATRRKIEDWLAHTAPDTHPSSA